MSIPRNEYPRPQLVREQWINLNGEWDFEIDNSLSGKEKEFFKRTELNSKITVTATQQINIIMVATLPKSFNSGNK